MDLLGASIKATFYDTNIARVIDEILINRSVYSASEFKDVIKWNETAFTTSELKLLGECVQQDCGFNNIKKRHVLLNLLRMFARKKLRLDTNSTGDYCAKVKFRKILAWREISLLLGEDLLTLAFLSDPESGLCYPLKYYAWPNVIEHDNIRLNYHLDSGLTDIHAHLNASADTFELTWLSFMNITLGRADKFEALRRGADLLRLSTTSEQFIEPVRLVRLAAGIRYWLFEVFIRNNQDGRQIRGELNRLFRNFKNEALWQEMMYDIQSCITLAGRRSFRGSDGEIIDYAITSFPGKEPYAIHAGERRLLHSFLSRYYRGDKIAHSLADYFFLYVLIKIRIRREFVQTNALIGFENFKTYENRKASFADRYRLFYQRYAVQSAIREGKNDAFEARVTKGGVPDGSIRRTIFGNYVREDINPESLTFVVHLLKHRELRDSKPRNTDVEKYKTQIDEVLEEYKYRKARTLRVSKLKNRDSLVKMDGRFQTLKQRMESYISDKVEWDALNKPLFKITGIDAAGYELNCLPESFGHVFRYARLRGIRGLTFHVGEDFYDIADGLRLVDEAIAFLDLEEVGRLGHATALGVDVKSYYEKRNYQVVTTKQRLLDTIVWLRHHLNGNPFPRELETKAESLFYEIGYWGIFNLEHYYLSQRLRSDDELVDDLNQSHWGKTAKSNEQDAVYGRGFKDSVCWTRQYLLMVDIIRKGNKKERFEYPDDIVVLVQRVQVMMRKLVASKHICVECNPSSNVKIGPIGKYENHHIFEIYKNGVQSGIGTDDKGVFATSLANEYSVIARAAMTHKMEEDDIIKMISEIKAISAMRRFSY